MCDLWTTMWIEVVLLSATFKWIITVLYIVNVINLAMLKTRYILFFFSTFKLTQLKSHRHEKKAPVSQVVQQRRDSFRYSDNVSRRSVRGGDGDTNALHCRQSAGTKLQFLKCQEPEIAWNPS